MKPVFQTTFKPELGPGAGNCHAACIASLLELPLAEVPNFMEIIDDDERVRAETKWWARRGFCLLYVEDGSDLVGLGYHIAIGDSPRGDWLHEVIANGTAIIHDPRPEGGGLRNIQSRGVLVPLNPLPPAPRPPPQLPPTE